MDGFRENSKLPSFVAADHHRYISPSPSPPPPPPPSSMNLFLQNPHAHFSNNLYPMFSTIDNKFNELQNETTTQKADYSFMPCEEEEEEALLSGDYYSYCDVAAAVGESNCCAKSNTDSCSQVGDEDDDDDDDDEEVSLDELLKNDEKAKEKMEVLAGMVGVDSTEPVIVLTEVVRVLKHLRRMKQF